jgi:hypothetical protein
MCPEGEWVPAAFAPQPVLCAQPSLQSFVCFPTRLGATSYSLNEALAAAIYGGYEYGFDALLRVVAPIGAACGSVHVSLTWDAVSTMYGQYALRLELKGQY